MNRLERAINPTPCGPLAAAILSALCLVTQPNCGSPTPGDGADSGSARADAGTHHADAGAHGSDAAVEPDALSSVDAASPTGDGHGVLVGYWPNWGDLGTYSLEHAAAQGYNLLVIAFGRLEGTTADVVYSAAIPQATRDAIKADIAATRSSYPEIRIIVSLGGANNTYSPDPDDAQLSIAAQNLVALLDEYDLDGVDFDVEYSTGTITPLAAKLRQLDADMLITAAPQVNYDDHWMLVTTGWSEDYAGGIEQELFDYLFLQGYNTVFYGAPYQSNDPEFIKASYDELETWVPDSVKLVAGVPASWHSASQASIQFADYTLPQTADNARPIANVAELIDQQVHAIRTAPGATGQFAGIMTWCTLDDAVYNDPPYAFAQGVRACVVDDDCD